MATDIRPSHQESLDRIQAFDKIMFNHCRRLDPPHPQGRRKGEIHYTAPSVGSIPQQGEQVGTGDQDPPIQVQDERLPSAEVPPPPSDKWARDHFKNRFKRKGQ